MVKAMKVMNTMKAMKTMKAVKTMKAMKTMKVMKTMKAVKAKGGEAGTQPKVLTVKVVPLSGKEIFDKVEIKSADKVSELMHKVETALGHRVNLIGPTGAKLLTNSSIEKSGLKNGDTITAHVQSWCNVFLSSNYKLMMQFPPNQEALRDGIREYWTEVQPKQRIYVMGLFDAPPASSIRNLIHTGLFDVVRTVAKGLTGAPFNLKITYSGYVCRDKWTEELVESILIKMNRPGSIFVVNEGSTQNLAQCMARHPRIRDALRTKVLEGEIAYVSSADCHAVLFGQDHAGTHI